MLESRMARGGDQPQWEQHERTHRTLPEQARCLDQCLEVPVVSAPHCIPQQAPVLPATADVSPESGGMKSILRFPMSIHSGLLVLHTAITPSLYTTADPSNSTVNNAISAHGAYSGLLIYILHPILPSTLTPTCCPPPLFLLPISPFCIFRLHHPHMFQGFYCSEEIP